MQELTIGINPLPINDLTLKNGIDSAQVDIKDDITALESANLALLFSFVIGASGQPLDFVDYIKRKNLERHFIITTED